MTILLPKVRVICVTFFGVFPGKKNLLSCNKEMTYMLSNRQAAERGVNFFRQISKVVPPGRPF